jgi:hypothetical protein
MPFLLNLNAWCTVHFPSYSSYSGMYVVMDIMNEFFFDVLLTMHLSIILAITQLHAQILVL